MNIETIDILEIWSSAILNNGGTYIRHYDDYETVIDHGGFYSAEDGGVILGSNQLLTTAVLEAVTAAWQDEDYKTAPLMFGIWMDQGKVCIDKVWWFMNEDSAREHSSRNNQRAFWDIANGKAVAV